MIRRMGQAMRDWRAAAVAAILLRLAVLWTSPENLLTYPRHDPDHYGHFADCLWHTGTFGRDAKAPVPSAYRPPLYPLLLAPLLALDNWAVAGLHAVAGALTVWATSRLASMVAGPRAGTLAAWLVALDPLLVGQAALLMTETVFVALVALWLAAWSAGRPQRAGLLLGLAALCRPTAWALGLAVGVAAGIRQPRAAFRMLAVAALLVAPWALRNGLQVGKFTPTTTHGGYTMYLGMNPWYYAAEVAGSQPWSAEHGHFAARVHELTAGLTEPQADAALAAAARKWIAANPGPAARTAWHHLGSLWSPLPRTGHGAALRWVFGAWTVVLYCLAALGAVRRGRSVWWLLAVPLALTAVHALLWSNIRMRAPAIPVLTVLAAANWGVAPRAVAAGKPAANSA